MSNTINLGETTINNSKLGDSQISKIYIGETQIWASIPPASFWNGSDTTLAQIVATQWGLTGGTVTKSGAITNGVIGTVPAYAGGCEGIDLNLPDTQDVEQGDLLFFSVTSGIDIYTSGTVGLFAIDGVEQKFSKPVLAGTTTEPGIEEDVYSINRTGLIGKYMRLYIYRENYSGSAYTLRFWDSDPR